MQIRLGVLLRQQAGSVIWSGSTALVHFSELILVTLLLGGWRTRN